MREAVGLSSWYGDPESIALRSELAQRHRCAVEEVVIASGIDELMGLIVRAFCGPGDACVATRGTYPTLFYHLNAYGARPEFAEPDASGGIGPHAVVDSVRRPGATAPHLPHPANP